MTVSKTQNYRNGLYVDRVGDTRFVKGENYDWWCLKKHQWYMWPYESPVAHDLDTKRLLSYDTLSLPEEYLT